MVLSKLVIRLVLINVFLIVVRGKTTLRLLFVQFLLLRVTQADTVLQYSGQYDSLLKSRHRFDSCKNHSKQRKILTKQAQTQLPLGVFLGKHLSVTICNWNLLSSPRRLPWGFLFGLGCNALCRVLWAREQLSNQSKQLGNYGKLLGNYGNQVCNYSKSIQYNLSQLRCIYCQNYA